MSCQCWQDESSVKSRRSRPAVCMYQTKVCVETGCNEAKQQTKTRSKDKLSELKVV